jgi:hypothetical protein
VIDIGENGFRHDPISVRKVMVNPVGHDLPQMRRANCSGCASSNEASAADATLRTHWHAASSEIRQQCERVNASTASRASCSRLRNNAGSIARTSAASAPDMKHSSS